MLYTLNHILKGKILEALVNKGDRVDADWQLRNVIGSKGRRCGLAPQSGIVVHSGNMRLHQSASGRIGDRAA